MENIDLDGFIDVAGLAECWRMIEQTTRQGGWLWHLDNTYREPIHHQNWWTVSVSVPQTQMVTRHFEKVQALQVVDAIRLAERLMRDWLAKNQAFSHTDDGQEVPPAPL